MYSFLSTGTNDEGGGATNLWRVAGRIQVDYDAVAGTIDLVAPTDITVSDRNSGIEVGTMRLTGVHLGEFNLDGDLLGQFTFELESNGQDSNFTDLVGEASGATVDFLDREYMSGSGFNSFGLGGDDLTISLWGNERVAGGNGSSDVNWGLDWSSTGALVPLPGAFVLAAVGLAAVGVGRRRLSSTGRNVVT